MQIQLVCLSDLVTRVRHRAAADAHFVVARFRHWQRVATRGKRIADHYRLMRRVKPVLIAWWKLVLQAKQTYLVDETRAMMRRHRQATLRSVVDSTPSRSTYGERSLTLEDLAALSSSHASQVSELAGSTADVLERTPSLAHSSAGSSMSSMHLDTLMNADDDIGPQLALERPLAPALQDDWRDVSCIQPAAIAPRRTFDVDAPSPSSVVDEPAAVPENNKDPESVDDPAVAALLAKHRRRLESLFYAHASSNTLALDAFLMLAKANGLFPALFTRRELSVRFEAAASPAATLTSSAFLRCLHDIAQLLLRDSPDATPSQRLQALLLVLDGHGSVLQKPLEVSTTTTSKARQEASRARVDAILAKVATQRLAKHREKPIGSSPRRRSPRWTRGPLDDVYAATPPKMTPSVLAQAMEKAQLRLLRRTLATRTALRSYEAPRQDGEVRVDLASSLGRSSQLHDVANHSSLLELSTLE
ncbi:hypothetical protein SPRG_22160 [Saprolegnia parasitica CBS 223.65]|uniref:Uncharacterized protein n=1 Tax=Saprolegnia parasitica (strain CBS 223.65) TaxID=695850 RepID=A0A067CFH5_SAPPC|nr:hypothetical protein SPRG_22160 [Saprolegnia parasitica CBS 223.65]KDO29218.1 hypothetical protein SPRG_22160 [Saprolegnia parasitica CBS 223.65]|eukprot:XP_012200154.1 hypothetical protein SPRG_22160 [Saprolegnia parasitica CBS 223.65]